MGEETSKIYIEWPAAEGPVRAGKQMEGTSRICCEKTQLGGKKGMLGSNQDCSQGKWEIQIQGWGIWIAAQNNEEPPKGF